jgi:hypothetical protein
MLFIIPQPIAAPVAAAAGAYDHGNRWAGLGAEPTAAEAPATAAGASPAATMAPEAPPEAPEAPPEPEILHIPCPNGHELETPLDMLDQDVLCPHCNAQFRLRRKNSVEYKQKKELEERVRLEKVGSLWLTWAIVAVVVVVLGLIGLIVASNLNQTPVPKANPKATSNATAAP